MTSLKRSISTKFIIYCFSVFLKISNDPIIKNGFLLQNNVVPWILKHLHKSQIDESYFFKDFKRYNMTHGIGMLTKNVKKRFRIIFIIRYYWFWNDSNTNIWIFFCKRYL